MLISKALLAICALDMLLAGPVAAGEIKSEPWTATDLHSGKNDNKVAKDISGIACIEPTAFPRTCVIVDDNSQKAQAVVLTDGRLEGKSMVGLVDDIFGDDKLELDGEGVAFDGKLFYVIGSHGHPRDKKKELNAEKDAPLIAARINAASHILVLKPEPDGRLTFVDNLTSLTNAIKRQPDLASHADQRLDENGLTIEGIAVVDDTLLAGFRGPTLSGGCAAILAVSVKSLKSGKPIAKEIKLHLGDEMGIRDLASDGDRILVLAGPAADIAGPYSIYSWDGKTEDDFFLVASLSAVNGAGDARKAEALLPIGSKDGGKQILILFDGEQQGSPLLIDIPPENLKAADPKPKQHCL